MAMSSSMSPGTDVLGRAGDGLDALPPAASLTAWRSMASDSSSV